MVQKAISLAVVAVLIATNLNAFMMMYTDKHAAQRNEWRLSEKSLFISAACFGALGGTLGMMLLHHKTRHWYFRLFFPLMLVVQIAVLFVLYRKFM